ncbi:MAG: hypothetical protein JKY42_00025 [Flavobacteriales bacterium]|nr:hypothetical protein [Flavobacteriales bacterium]
MKRKSLLEWEAEKFYRGVVFRFKAKYPFEEVVDFMAIEDIDAPLRLKSVCSTGFHAGQTELAFPEEAKHSDGGVSVLWLKENWEKWVYPECGIEEVKFIENYPSSFGWVTS